MKRTYIITIVLLVAVLACNDEYLEKYPLTTLNDGYYWKNAGQVEMYANQFYANFSSTSFPNEVRKDNKSDNQGSNVRSSYLWGETVAPNTGGGWSKGDWLDIRKCNYALDRTVNMERTPELLRSEGEIRFFRAYYYFEKVQLFGDVPWFEHVVEVGSEDLYKARDSRKTVIANLLNDLNFAIQYLPETSATDRLTKYAALAFKARVCLFEGTFRKYHNLGDFENLLREAVSASEAIMNSGRFSVYSTGKPGEDYFNLFIQKDLHGNSENIFAQYYIVNLRAGGISPFLKIQESGYTKDFVETYLCTDGLPISLSPLYEGDATYSDEFVNRDPRMLQSVYDSDRPILIDSKGVKHYQAMPLFDYLKCYTGYIMIKGFSPLQLDQENNKCEIDEFIFRYSEVLVGYAEAKAELGECTQAILDKSVNLLRNRVGMPHLTVNVGFTDPNWPDWEIPVSPLINEIRRERRIELSSEGGRWDDLVRWKAGKLLENPKTYLGARDPGTGEYHILYQGLTRTWYDRLYLQPVPLQEITLNPNLVQNPGWE